MFAIIRSGGRQYRVQAGDTVRVEKINHELGAELVLKEVLLIGGGEKTFVGEPLVANAQVTVVVTQQTKAAKVIVFKKRRRQGYRRTQGHRQLFTELFVKEIVTPEGQAVKTDKAAQVINPAKKIERVEKIQQESLLAKLTARKAGKKVERKEKPVKATQVTKVAKKKAGAKKAGKKKAGKKKLAKKAGKKTTKKK